MVNRWLILVQSGTSGLGWLTTPAALGSQPSASLATGKADAGSAQKLSVLHQVYWRRVILDEANTTLASKSTKRTK